MSGEDTMLQAMQDGSGAEVMASTTEVEVIPDPVAGNPPNEWDAWAAPHVNVEPPYHLRVR